MLNEKNIRQALDNRLSGLTASEARRMRIRAAAYQERREEKPVRSKKSLVIAIALIVAMLTSAIAVAEGLNLFDYFGKHDKLLAALAPKATLEITEPALIEHPHLGKVAAKIDSAYFDGLGLSLAYSISNSDLAVEYTPTAEEIAQMTLEEYPVVPLYAGEPYEEILAAYNEAVENGTSYGYKVYSVYPSDHTFTDDGIDLGPYEGYSDYDENGALCELLKFPELPVEKLQGRDALTVTKKIYQQEATTWFDGKNAYVGYERQQVGVITATIPKDKEAVKTFSGSGVVDGVECTFTAEVSPMVAVLHVECSAPFDSFLPVPPADAEHPDTWGELGLRDQFGCEYGARNGFPRNGDTTATVYFDGTAVMPETLTAYLYGNGEWMDQPALFEMEGVLLTLDE